MNTNTHTNIYCSSKAERVFSISGLASLISVHLSSRDKVALATCSKSMFYSIEDLTRLEVVTACGAIAKKIQKIIPRSEQERSKLAIHQNRIFRFLHSIEHFMPKYNLSYIPLFQDMACDILLNIQLKVAQLESYGIYKSAFTNELEELPLQITSVNNELHSMDHKASSLSLTTYVINCLLYLSQNDYKSLYKKRILSIIDSEIKKKHFLIAERIIDLYGKFFIGKSIYFEKLLIESERIIGFTESQTIVKKGLNAIKKENRNATVTYRGFTNFL